MFRILRWAGRGSAFILGLVIGLLCVALHLYEVVARKEIPLLSKLEASLEDVKFHQRGPRQTDGKLAVAAIDEASIARFGRFPWDRRVLAELVDKLSAEGAQAIGFDMALSDQDLGAEFAGAKRFRARFGDVSLAEGRGQAAVDRISEATADIAGAASALDTLAHDIKPEGEPIYRTARGRLDDGRGKLVSSQSDFEILTKQHENFARELEGELHGVDPDQVLGASMKKAGNVVVGFFALTERDTGAMLKDDIASGVKRVQSSALGAPETRVEEGGVTRARPLERSRVKEYPALLPPLPPIVAGAAGLGFYNAFPDDADGVIRQTALLIQVHGIYLPSLDARMVAQVLGVSPSRIVAVASDSIGSGNIDSVDFDGKLSVPTDDRGLLRINYYGPNGTFPNYSVSDIIDGRTPPGAFKNKVVVVGATAQGTYDQRLTPFSKSTPGLETHCNAIETMLSAQFLSRDTWVRWGELFFLILFALIYAAIFARVRVAMALPTTLFFTAAIWGSAFLLFRLGYDVFTALPLVEMLSVFVFVTVFRFFTEERDKRQLRKAFQLYLNPDVMEEMLAQPEKLQLGGEEKEISVLFSDIRGFTTISEKLAPQALVKLLNDYLTPMTDLVFGRRGTLDKYIGDAVMAFFGAPIENKRNALDACECALDMIETLERLREHWRIDDAEIPFLDIGIGINSGPMVVGNMGSTQRFNYTVMGDNVNLASRLEGLNKDYGTHIIISEPTLKAARSVGGPDCLAVRELDQIVVKGKREPVRIFELRGKGSPGDSEKKLIDQFSEALTQYRAGRFVEAKAQFEKCLALVSDDGPSIEFITDCDEMIAHPPGPEWNGVRIMKHK
jgi:adenylate cyclase